MSGLIWAKLGSLQGREDCARQLYRSFRASPGRSAPTSSGGARARDRRLHLEATASIFANSLALLAETFHVLIDVVALGIAFVAVWLGTRPVTDRRTFGLLRLEILATVLNTVLLLIVAVVVLVEGVRRFGEPSHVQSSLVLAVAAVGLVSNGVSIFLLRDPHASLAVRAAYLDVLADVAASIAVIISALANIFAGVSSRTRSRHS